MESLYLFGAPGYVGGGATKIFHLIRLLKNSFDITVVLPNAGVRKSKAVKKCLGALSVRGCLFNDLPKKVEGVALVICQEHFFSSGLAKRVKETGLRLVWSNEMMWPFKGEDKAAAEGLIDRVLWVSQFQAEAFQEMYATVPGFETGNYIDADDFCWKERTNPVLTIGRLSRPDPFKYPYNFPVFYEDLCPFECRFRVMAWDNNVAKAYRWHKFDNRWDLLKANSYPTLEFLQSLDLFVYPLGHRVRESWGRSVVEAMLTGCVPLVPSGHQFHKLMQHEISGFICDEFEEWKHWTNWLHRDRRNRIKIGKAARDFAASELCNVSKHREIWERALTF